MKTHKSVKTKQGNFKRLCDGLEINENNEKFTSRDAEQVTCTNCIRMSKRRKKAA